MAGRQLRSLLIRQVLFSTSSKFPRAPTIFFFSSISTKSTATTSTTTTKQRQHQQHHFSTTTRNHPTMSSLPPPTIQHALMGQSAKLPSPPATPTITLTPITLPTPSRPVDLQLRLTLPATTSNPTSPLPVILFSHGQGASHNLSSLHGYGPLADHWASHGFAVIQPTHLSSRSLSLPAETAGAPLFWRERVEDMKTILHRFDEIENTTEVLLGGRKIVLDRERIAVAGHSMGSHTASVLMGMTLRDPSTNELITNLSEPHRIRAGILLAGLGDGGASLSEWGHTNLPFHRSVSFAEMATPCLVVVGDADESAHLTTRGWKWHADPYYLAAKGPKDLLTLFGGDHCFGISGYDAKETVGESMERVAAVQRMTTAYLRGVLCGEGEGWGEAKDALREIGSIGAVESK